MATNVNKELKAKLRTASQIRLAAEESRSLDRSKSSLRFYGSRVNGKTKRISAVG